MANRKDHIVSESDEDDKNAGNSDDAAVLDDENVYEVEKIVGMTTIDGKVMYRVRWLNYSSQYDTWEPFENLLTCQDLVAEYVNKDKKKKKTSEKSTKKKKKASKRKSTVDSDRGTPSPELVPVQKPTADTTQPRKDRFWRDLEEGNINLFAGDDMYSKVKERSSSRAQMEKKRRASESTAGESASASASSSTSTSKAASVKPRRRISIIVSSSSDSEPEERRVEEEKKVREEKKVGEEKKVEEPKKTLQPSDDFINQIVQSQTADLEQREKRRDVHKSKKTSNLLKPTTHSSQSGSKQSETAKKVQEKKENHENRRPQSEIRFEFRHYNPEEWIPKEAYKSNQILNLTNVQFRDAVKEGEYETLRRALNSKTPYNMEQSDSSGTTLLMIAAMSGFDDIVELLVMRGSSINATQKHGATALMLAAEKGHTCVVAVLLGLGAHMDMQVLSGETALMKACKKGHRQIVQLLLEYGASYTAVASSDMTALKFAKMYNQPGIENLLKEHQTRVLGTFEQEVFLTLNNTAEIIELPPFPVHCFALNESTIFKIVFDFKLTACPSGVGMLLFIAHARITSQEIKCRFYGPCAVTLVTLNGVKQQPLTEDANFVFSFSPLQNGRNEVIINTVPAIVSKSKLIVCAYKAKLKNPQS